MELFDSLIAAAVAGTPVVYRFMRIRHERWILSDAKRTKRAVRLAKAKR